MILACATSVGCASRHSVSAALDDPSLTTASISGPTIPEGIEAEDVQAMMAAVTTASPPPSPALVWQSLATGNEGTVRLTREYMDTTSRKCRRFETEADTFMGVALYDGETCEVRPGYWVMNWLSQRQAR